MNETHLERTIIETKVEAVRDSFLYDLFETPLI